MLGPVLRPTLLVLTLSSTLIPACAGSRAKANPPDTTLLAAPVRDDDNAPDTAAAETSDRLQEHDSATRSPDQEDVEESGTSESFSDSDDDYFEGDGSSDADVEDDYDSEDD